MPTSPRASLLRPALIALLFGLVGCRAESESNWAPVSSEPPDSVQARLETADAAIRDLASRLMSALGRQLAEGGAPSAIDVCRRIAPQVASEVGARSGVSIGRTSFRLRNPRNEPPDWARPLVDARHAEEARFVREDGAVALLRPIRLQKACLICHGPEEDLDPEVRREIAAAYPSDRAIGFGEGDLRGYFWVEVP